MELRQPVRELYFPIIGEEVVPKSVIRALGPNKKSFGPS
jgi:hypothetical protein